MKQALDPIQDCAWSKSCLVDFSQRFWKIPWFELCCFTISFMNVDFGQNVVLWIQKNISK